jgi:uncharacterized protein YyaL (SSP411 family)
VLIDHNALIAQALITAADAFRDDSLRRLAFTNLNYLWLHARDRDGAFYHTLTTSSLNAPSAPPIGGLVVDQVYMLNAFLAAYQSSGSSWFLDRTKEAADLLISKFLDRKSGLLRDHGPSEEGTVLKEAAAGTHMFYDDLQTPSVQALAAQDLYSVSELLSDDRYRQLSYILFAPAPTSINPEAGPLAGTFGAALEQQANGDAVVAILGNSSDPTVDALLRVARTTYRPSKLVIPVDIAKGQKVPKLAEPMFRAVKSPSAPMAFLCAGKACATPVSKPNGSEQPPKKFRRTQQINRRPLNAFPKLPQESVKFFGPGP